LTGTKVKWTWTVSYFLQQKLSDVEMASMDLFQILIRIHILVYISIINGMLTILTLRQTKNIYAYI
jgi:hypothetical protein